MNGSSDTPHSPSPRARQQPWRPHPFLWPLTHTWCRERTKERRRAGPRAAAGQHAVRVVYPPPNAGWETAPVAAGPIRYVESDGLQIAYQVVGNGPVDVVYVPGSANHIESMWDIPEIAGFTQRLASYSRLILIDKRGTGLSDRLPDDNRSTVEERMHDVTAVLDATDSSSAILFGTADGTPVALLAGATYPDRIRGLALWASSARLLWDEDYPIGVPDEAVELVLGAFRAAWGNDDDPGLEVVAP